MVGSGTSLSWHQSTRSPTPLLLSTVDCLGSSVALVLDGFRVKSFHQLWKLGTHLDYGHRFANRVSGQTAIVHKRFQSICRIWTCCFEPPMEALVRFGEFRTEMLSLRRFVHRCASLYLLWVNQQDQVHLKVDYTQAFGGDRSSVDYGHSCSISLQYRGHGLEIWVQHRLELFPCFWCNWLYSTGWKGSLFSCQLCFVVRISSGVVGQMYQCSVLSALQLGRVLFRVVSLVAFCPRHWTCLFCSWSLLANRCNLHSSSGKCQHSFHSCCRLLCRPYLRCIHILRSFHLEKLHWH